VVVPEGLLLAVTLFLAFVLVEGKKGMLLASIKIVKDVVHHLAVSSIVSIKVNDCSSLVYIFLKCNSLETCHVAIVVHDVIRSMLAAHANSGKNDSGTQSCLTVKDIFLDVNRVFIAQLYKESIIFGSAPFDHVAVDLIIALCKVQFSDHLHQ
jgi:hypothetical protein